MEPLQKCSSIHLTSWDNKRSGVMCYVLNNYAVLLGSRCQPAQQTGSWEMLNYCHSPATDWDSWRWKEDSDCLLSHLEKHKSPRFTASCTKVLFLLCSCAVICIVLFVKGPVFPLNGNSEVLHFLLPVSGIYKGQWWDFGIPWGSAIPFLVLVFCWKDSIVEKAG